MTPATLIAERLELNPPLPDPANLPAGTICAVMGQPIHLGYPRRDLTTEATAEFLDHFHGRVHGHVGVDPARLYKSSNPSYGNPCAKSLFVTETYGSLPVIARDSAAPASEERWQQFAWGRLPRPCWSELVREVWPARQGEPVAILLTTDQKKRLWPGLQAGTLGKRTPLYCYDTRLSINRLLWLDWEALLECLDLLETAYGLGAAKPLLLRGLYGCAALTPPERFRWERKIAPWRERPEFIPALLMAQKPLVDVAKGEPEPVKAAPAPPNQTPQLSLFG